MISEMAAGAAHELHNPLAVISGRAQMELSRAEDEGQANALRIIVEQTQRASQIVMDLMSFAKPDAPKPLVQRLLDVLQPLAQQWREEATLRSDQLIVNVGDDAVTVAADPLHLRLILDAVVANAVEACPKETARIEINSPSRASDEKIRIVVADNGVGMPRYVRDHAVDPFFSSRPAGRGRGLGLSRAYRLVEINNGRLSIESEVHRGTRVTIELPSRATPPP
jgi:signal transduction histidine kinase